MYCLKKRSALVVLSAVLLVFSTPTKSEPATIVVGGVCLAGGALIGYLCSGLKEELPSSKLAVAQAESLRKKAAGEHYYVIQASAEKTENGFRQALCNRFSSVHEVDKQVDDLELSLHSLNKKIEQLQKVSSSSEKIVTDQKIQMDNEESALKNSRNKLMCALNRFKKNKQYFNLHAQLSELQQDEKFVFNGMYPSIEQERYLQKKQEKASSIYFNAERFGYECVKNRALGIEVRLRVKLTKLKSSEEYKREHESQLQHASKMKCQELHNAEIERQADLDRQVRLQEIAAQKYRNALRQQELDLAEGRVEQRVADHWKNIVAQERNKRCQSQETLSKSLVREQGLRRQLSQKESEKTELVARMAFLQKQLRKLQAREREKFNNNANASSQEGLPQCNSERCIAEDCPAHPAPSAPLHQREGEGYTGGPPQTVYGATRR